MHIQFTILFAQYAYFIILLLYINIFPLILCEMTINFGERSTDADDFLSKVWALDRAGVWKLIRSILMNFILINPPKISREPSFRTGN